MLGALLPERCLVSLWWGQTPPPCCLRRRPSAATLRRIVLKLIAAQHFVRMILEYLLCQMNYVTFCYGHINERVALVGLFEMVHCTSNM